MQHRLLNNRTGKLEEPITYFSYEKCGNILTCVFEAKDSALNSFSSKDNDTLYLGDVVEIFLDLGNEYYYEFEVAPNNATFVAKIVNREPVFIENNFFKSKVIIENNNYIVTMNIDLSKLDKCENIQFNAFRIETKGIRTDYILQALSPTLCDTFHVRDKFINL